MLISTTDDDLATYTLQFTGIQDAQGHTNAQGSIDFFPTSTGKIASSLTALASTFSAQLSPEGDLSIQVGGQQ